MAGQVLKQFGTYSVPHVLKSADHILAYSQIVRELLQAVLAIFQHALKILLRDRQLYTGCLTDLFVCHAPVR